MSRPHSRPQSQPHPNAPDDAPDPDEHDPVWSRERYHAVLDRIEACTGGRNQDNDQPPGIDSMHIHLHLSHASYGRYAPEAIDSALKAAVENKDVIRYPGIDGRMRYARRTPEGLMAVILEEAQREHPRRELIGWLNRQLDELKQRETAAETERGPEDDG